MKFSQKIHKRRNDRKGRYILAHFLENCQRNGKTSFLVNYFFGRLRLELFAIFSQKCAMSISTLPVILSFICNSNFFTFFFRKVEKLNISAIYKSIIIICAVILPLVFIYMFCKKEILKLEPQGEHHLS